jgi:hypothetical protein
MQNVSPTRLPFPALPRTQDALDFLRTRIRPFVRPAVAQATPAGYGVEFDYVRKAARVTFEGRIERKSILQLQLFLETLSEQVKDVSLDVSRAHGANIRSLATLAMLCGALERKGMSAGVTGVLPALRGEAIRARVHHLVALV